jgi:hypothetical protein
MARVAGKRVPMAEEKDRTELERESLLPEEGSPGVPGDDREPHHALNDPADEPDVEEAEAIEEDLDREGTERPGEET